MIVERDMEGKKKFTPNPSLKLMEQVREVLRYHHYAYRTEQTYCDWIKRYLKFYEYARHPKDGDFWDKLRALFIHRSSLEEQ